MSRPAKKIFLIGADGYLGHALNRRFRSAGWSVVESGLASSKRDDYVNLNIRDRDATHARISEIAPDLVVHAAGISSLQGCESDKDLARSTNVDGTTHVVEGALQCSSRPRVVFLSSDYVFDGVKGGYDESSERNPKTFYGETKMLGEDIILSQMPESLVVRTSNVYGRGGKFFSFIMDNLKRSRPVELYTNTHYTPTYLDFFTGGVLSLLRKGTSGIVHVAGATRLSRFDFGRSACEALGVDPGLVQPSEQPDSGLVAQDSSLVTHLPPNLLAAFNPTPAEAFQYLLGHKICPYFEFNDQRGSIRGLSRGGPWREINHASSRQGTKRGNHWHRDTSESFYIIRGEVRVETKDMLSGEEHSFLAGTGDFFTIPQMTLHSFSMLADAEWINLLSAPMDEDAPDILNPS